MASYLHKICNIRHFQTLYRKVLIKTESHFRLNKRFVTVRNVFEITFFGSFRAYFFNRLELKANFIYHCHVKELSRDLKESNIMICSLKFCPDLAACRPLSTTPYQGIRRINKENRYLKRARLSLCVETASKNEKR